MTQFKTVRLKLISAIYILSVAWCLSERAQAQADPDWDSLQAGPTGAAPAKQKTAVSDSGFGLPNASGQTFSARKALPPIKVVYEGLDPRLAQSGGPPSQDGLRVTTELEFQTGGRTIRTERTVYLPRNSESWHQVTKPREGILLLGRIHSSGADSAVLEYLIIDANRDDFVLSAPKFKAKLNERAQMMLESSKDQIRIQVLVESRDGRKVAGIADASAVAPLTGQETDSDSP